jgi:hypothetical protein
VLTLYIIKLVTKKLISLARSALGRPEVITIDEPDELEELEDSTDPDASTDISAVPELASPAPTPAPTQRRSSTTRTGVTTRGLLKGRVTRKMISGHEYDGCKTHAEGLSKHVIPTWNEAQQGYQPGTLVPGDAPNIDSHAQAMIRSVETRIDGSVKPEDVFASICEIVVHNLQNARFGTSKSSTEIGGKFNTIHTVLYNRANHHEQGLGLYREKLDNFHLHIKRQRDEHHAFKVKEEKRARHV